MDSENNEGGNIVIMEDKGKWDDSKEFRLRLWHFVAVGGGFFTVLLISSMFVSENWNDRSYYIVLPFALVFTLGSLILGVIQIVRENRKD